MECEIVSPRSVSYRQSLDIFARGSGPGAAASDGER